MEAEAAAFEGLEEKSLWVSAEDVPLGRGLEWGKRGEQVDWSPNQFEPRQKDVV